MPQLDTAGDLYALLGVQRDATLSTIRIAYRGKVAQHHPNTGGDPEVLARVREAYGVLISGQRRAHYDATGEILPIEGTATREPQTPEGPRDDRGAVLTGEPTAKAFPVAEQTPGTATRSDAEASSDVPVRSGGAADPPQQPLAELPSVLRASQDLAGAAAGSQVGDNSARADEQAAPHMGLAQGSTPLGPAAAELGGARPAAFLAVHDAPAKEKPVLGRSAPDRPCRSSTAVATEVREPAVQQPAVKQPASCTRLSGGSPESTSAGSSLSTSSTDLDSQEGGNASTAADAQQAFPIRDEDQAAVVPTYAAPRKVRTLAEALADAEAKADAVDESTLDNAATAESQTRLASESPQAEEGLPKLEAIVDCDGPLLYRCSQGVLFGKRSVEPTGGNVIKLKRPIGTYIHSTGRRWKGPGGGIWCELAASHVSSDHVHWMLVKGPGFGLEGPALIDVSVLKKGGPYEAACVKVCRVGYRESDMIIYESFMSKEATMWGLKKAIQEATGLNAQRCYLSREKEQPASLRSTSEASKQQPNLLHPVQDEQTIRGLLVEEDDLRLYMVYTGDFGKDYEPAKTLAN